MKIGLEIHQRLNTHKLFCACKSESDGKEVGILRRRLHSVKSEIGETDRTAKYEESKEVEYKYIITDNSCLVEADEEPPHNMNEEALKVALAMAEYMNMDLVNEIFVMRKTVLDGSNTSGFQRTAIVGMNGKLDTSKGDVGIQTLCIEEESAGIVGEKGSNTFTLDRLGIPLIEIATDPDIKDGEHAKEVAQKIGMLLRMTGKAARGIGTIRQDLNVSIEGGARVEIKGVQELDEIPLIIDKEVKRQEKLLEIIERLPKPTPHIEPVVDITNEVSKTNKKWILNIIKDGGKAKGMVLRGLKGILGIELYENRRYGSELSDYAKVYGFGGLIHGDENLEKYGLNREEIENRLGVDKQDNYVILIGDEKRMDLAFRDIFNRAYLREVPKETRRVTKDGATAYMRPMATGARMYPETDVESIKVSRELIEASRVFRPRDPKEVLNELEKELNKDLASQLIKSKHLFLYYKLKKEIPAKVVAVTLTNSLKTLSREGVSPSEDKIEDTLKLYAEGKITKKAVEEVLRLSVKENKDPIEIVREHNLERISGEELEKLVKELGDPKKVIAKYRLRVEAEELFKK